MEAYSLDDDDYTDYDSLYGKTPPRTRILKKNKEKRDKGQEAPLNRRNTYNSLFDDLIAKADSEESEGSNKKMSKRQQKLLRVSERDLKLDIASAQTATNDSANGLPNLPPTPQPSYQIGSSDRFMSLQCRTVQCTKYLASKDSEHSNDSTQSDSIEECPESRVMFYKTLSILIRMGDRNPKRGISREETLWQNELKDLIWLELQAYHQDRTPIEHDSYLCEARQKVEPLLQEIMSFKFKKCARRFSTQNSDSGIEEDCVGCMSLSCLACVESQVDALKQVDRLMNQLEQVENLFPSSKGFAELFPLYSSPEFVGRYKAISLWYNMTKHQRLKISILSRLLYSIQNKTSVWPLQTDDSTYSMYETDSPYDSYNSSPLSATDSSVRIFNTSSLFGKTDDVSPCRRYIENILKTRALDKSLGFLEKLHKNVLKKVQFTLEIPEDDKIFEKVCVSDKDELRRYGVWSPEAKDLNLPSYRANFIFLASVPLHLIHEYLRMRIEQKPEKPSPLSIRQLMRELKEGITIATTEKIRYQSYIKSATMGTKYPLDEYDDKITSFDKCLLKVFKDYLNYLQDWCEINKDNFQKKLLEDEYEFCCDIVDFIPLASEIMIKTFSDILIIVLNRNEKRIGERIDNLLKPKDVLLMQDKQVIFSVCRELQTLFNEEREICLKAMAFCRTLFRHDSLQGNCETRKQLAEPIINFKCIIPNAISKVQESFETININMFEEGDRQLINTRIREILMQGFRFGFEFYKEMSDVAPAAVKKKLARSMLQFANLWMTFVTERYERGRGMRPRWAYQGLLYLLTVCEPANTMYLTDDEFENLKTNMDNSISHLIGTTAPTPTTPEIANSPKLSIDKGSKSRGSSPSPRPTYTSQRSNRKPSMEQASPVTDHSDGISFPICKKEEKISYPSVKIKLPPQSHIERCREAVEALENETNAKLREQMLIGKVLSSFGEKTPIRRRYVNFSWQRGIKIGKGSFGKVYTAVNNATGEMMAVKEISLQLHDNIAVEKVTEESKILEGISHEHLVKYYGVEVHKNEMLLFMEYCPEGTLEKLVADTENGLPEPLLRKYTFQLVSGVIVLHDHGIVHRDIKTANIFMTVGGNCLKIGDFGCAVKIKSNQTMQGEVKGYVGTPAYMAPEVCRNNTPKGYGRAADIWSVGCVVVEMASGKRPWTAQFVSEAQIIFAAGSDKSPNIPDHMTDEGVEFLEMCLKHNPEERATAYQLRNHNFCKVVNII